jgi:glycosyltransferase involved in cell wall biosynthesis
MKPKVLFAGRRHFSLPLDAGLRRRYDALGGELEWRQLGSGHGRDERFRLLAPLPALDGPLFYLRFPFALARELRSFRPDVVIVQGAEETALALAARALARSPVRVVFEVHGDWAAPTRMYGSPLRRLLAPLSALLVRAALRADGVRTVSPYTSRLVRSRGVEPAAEFPALMDFDAFAAPTTPLPEQPSAIFVGSLEPAKSVDVLLRALDGARLHVVGRGSLAGAIRAAGAEHDEWLPADELAAAIDRAWVLVLPSRSEGFGRVIVEAARRGRATVGSRVGGIPDLVEHEETGLLVEPGDAGALEAELARILSDRELAERLGVAAHERSERWVTTPVEFAARIRDLVDRVTKLPV